MEALFTRIEIIKVKFIIDKMVIIKIDFINLNNLIIELSCRFDLINYFIIIRITNKVNYIIIITLFIFISFPSSFFII